MNFDGITNIMAAIVTVALVTTLVAHKDTANVIRAFGDAFAGSIRSARGA